MRLRRYKDVEERKLEWLWEGRIPMGQVTMIAGDPGTGKSQLTCWMTAAVTTGSSWPDGSRAPRGSVVMLNAEDDPGPVIRPRLRACGADLDQVLVLEEEDDLFTVPDTLPGLERTLAKLAIPAKLIVIDPAEAWMSPRVDLRNNQSCRRALRPLGEMASRLGLAVVMVQHMPKDTTRPAIYRFSGSIGVIGAARAGFLVEHKGGLSVLAPAKINWAEKPESLAYQMESVEYDSPGGVVKTSRIRWRMPPLDADADDFSLREGETPSDIKEAVQFLQRFLRDGGRRIDEVRAAAKAEGIAAGALRTAAKFLGVHRTESMNGRGPIYFWELMDHFVFDPEGFH